MLKEISAPTTENTMKAMVAWVSAEGSMAKWNPLATTQKMPGSTDFNSVGVQNYTSLEQGLAATEKTLGYPNLGYEAIVQRFQRDRLPRRILRAVEQSAWGTGGLALRVLSSWHNHPERYRLAKDTLIGS